MALPTLPPLQDAETDALANLLDWSELLAVEPVVIGTKTGHLQSMLRYTCPDTQHQHPAERASYLARLHEVLCALGEDWTLDGDWWHEPAPAYPEVEWTHPVDWLVDELRRLDFEAALRHESTSYLTLSWRPPIRTRRWMRDLFLTRGAEREGLYALDEDLLRFQRGVERFVDLLAPLLLNS